uniref:Cnidarian restricted protein n=1 Tax=Clytia hemisphaerica TaxID=252671 RepID=A0A7M5WTJ9_9CNID
MNTSNVLKLFLCGILMGIVLSRPMLSGLGDHLLTDGVLSTHACAKTPKFPPTNGKLKCTVDQSDDSVTCLMDCDQNFSHDFGGQATDFKHFPTFICDKNSVWRHFLDQKKVIDTSLLTCQPHKQ